MRAAVAVSKRWALLASVGLVGISSGVCAHAAAEPAPAAEQAESSPAAAPADNLEGPEILVTGTRLQNQRAIALKRTAIQIVDSLAQDDIGRQPDFNISDAVRRAAGISTVPEEDEGQYITVRGINADLTFVTFDGGAVATAAEGASRRVSLEFFPAPLVSRLDVVKSRTPDIDGNTIGGQVNMVTRSAYDTAGVYAVANFMGGYFTGDKVPVGIADSSGKNGLSYRGDAVIASRFGDDDQFGIVLAGAYLYKDRDEERTINTGLSYGGNNALASTPVAPRLAIASSYHNPNERYSVVGKLEFKPSSAFYASLQANYFYQNDYARRESLILNGGTPDFAAARSGTVANANISLGSDYFKAQNTNFGVQFLSRYTGSDGLSADVRASHTTGEFYQTSPAISFAAQTQQSYRYLYADDQLRLSPVNAASFTTLSNYRLTQIQPFDDDYDNKISEIEGNIQKRFGADGAFGIKGGVKYRSSEQDHTRNQTRYTAIAPFTTLDAFRMPTNYVTPSGLPGFFPSQTDVLAYLQANPGRFTTTVVGSGNDYTVRERVYAGYLSLDYSVGAVKAIVGGRWEKTKVNSRSFAVAQANDYDNFLPSALVIFDASERLKLRASYARALGRANIGDLRIAQVPAAGSATPNIQGGNPNLDPRIADNFDLSGEYYFDGGASLISLALFYKDIKNEIFGVSTPIVVNGVPGSSIQPQNVGGSKLKGIEINLVKSKFDFLPGILGNLGASANFTRIWGEADGLTPTRTLVRLNNLFEQPKYIANASLSYQNGKLDARLTYNYTGAYRTNFTGDSLNRDFVDTYDTFDMSIRYRLSEHFSIAAEGRNLLLQNLRRYSGAAGDITIDRSRFGRSFFVGGTYKL